MTLFETITPAKARLLRDHGVTRISLGAQSFQCGHDPGERPALVGDMGAVMGQEDLDQRRHLFGRAGGDAQIDALDVLSRRIAVELAVVGVEGLRHLRDVGLVDDALRRGDQALPTGRATKRTLSPFLIRIMAIRLPPR